MHVPSTFSEGHCIRGRRNLQRQVHTRTAATWPTTQRTDEDRVRAMVGFKIHGYSEFRFRSLTLSPQATDTPDATNIDVTFNCLQNANALDNFRCHTQMTIRLVPTVPEPDTATARPREVAQFPLHIRNTREFRFLPFPSTHRTWKEPTTRLPTPASCATSRTSSLMQRDGTQ